MFETLFYIHIAQNIRAEGMWRHEKNCANKDILYKMVKFGLIDDTHWQNRSIQTTNDGEKLSKALMEERINQDIFKEMIETTPQIIIDIIQNYQSLPITYPKKSYVQNNVDFPQDFIPSLPYNNEKCYNLCKPFFLKAVKEGRGCIAHNYVSTSGGEERGEYYVLSDEILDAIKEVVPERIPKEIDNKINDIKDKLYALKFLFHYNPDQYNGLKGYSLVEQNIMTYLKELTDSIDTSKNLFSSGFSSQMPYMIRDADTYKSKILKLEKELDRQLTDLLPGKGTHISKPKEEEDKKITQPRPGPPKDTPEPSIPLIPARKKLTIPPSESKQQLLECFSPTNIHEDISEDYLRMLEEKLKVILSNFEIKCEVDWRSFDIGPRLIRGNITLNKGVKISKVKNISGDIANKLFSDKELFTFEKDDEVPKDLFIESVPSKGAVGIYIPRSKFIPIGVREILEEFPTYNTLNFSIGKNIVGENQYSNLEKMPHLLIAGHTNSGKSVFLNSLIVGLIYQNSPKDLQLIMIDPKGGLEFAMYNELPFLAQNIIDNPEKAQEVLKTVISEMERRYTLFKNSKVKKLAEYNSKKIDDEKLPYFIIVIDEFADIILDEKNKTRKELAALVQKLAQKGRAAGIHIIIATQKPVNECFPTLIKGNIPARIAFRVTKQEESVVILGEKGAELLLGSGDMLVKDPNRDSTNRYQAPYIKNEEIEKFIDKIKELYM